MLSLTILLQSKACNQLLMKLNKYKKAITCQCSQRNQNKYIPVIKSNHLNCNYIN